VNQHTLHGALDETAHAFPNASIYFPQREARLSLSELADASRISGAALRRRGVVPGTLVGILAPTSPAFLTALFGIFRAGGVATPLPLPTTFRSPATYVTHVAQLLRQVDIRYAIIDSSMRSLIPRLQQAVPNLQSVITNDLESAPPVDLSGISPDQLAIVQFTSGSLSTPKGAALSHENVLSGVAAINTGIEGSPRDVYAQWIPLFHDMGLIGMLVATICGCDQYLWPASAFVRDPAGWLRAFSECRATVHSGPNFAYEYLLSSVSDQELNELDLSSWRVALNGSELVRAQTVEQFSERFGRAGFRPEAMFPVYGLAEATLAVTFPRLGETPVIQSIDRHSLAESHRIVQVPSTSSIARSVVGVGQPVPGIELRLVTEGGEEAIEGQLGEIQVRGESVMRRYYGQQALTDGAFSNGWLKTGDLGYVSRDELFVVGRSKELITVRGVNYYPQDVEIAVRDLPGVYRQHCVALASHESTSDEQPMSVILETQLATPAARAELAACARKQIALATGLDDVAVYCVNPLAIPRTTSGKEQRLQARELAASLHASEGLAAGTAPGQ
jgi:fatty-acyl-CoA synthase